MRYSNGTRNTGDKLLPKIIQAVSQSVIATKRGLGPHEHKLRMGIMREFMGWGGEEIADLYRPLIELATNDPDKPVHPLVKAWLEDVASGEDQWKALSGILMGGVSGSLGQSISNALAPVTYRLNELSPQIYPDAGTVVQSVAQHLTSEGVATSVLRQLAIHPAWYTTLYAMAQTIPDLSTLNELKYRGELTEQDVDYWLERSALPDSLIERLRNIRFNLPTVADAALAVLRGDLTLDQGRYLAAENGYREQDFNTLLLNTGEPPGPQELAEAYRRKFIDKATFIKGILQSRVRDEWVDTLLKLRYSPASTADAVQAVVQGYLARKDAISIADQNGLEPGSIDWLIETAGEPLSRTEMTYLVNRGLATEAQYKEALRQSRLKDSYINMSVDLIKRPATIGDAVRGYVQGYLSGEQTDKLLGENGLRSEDYELVKEIDGIPLSLTEVLRLHRYGEMTIQDVEQALRESRLKDKYIPYALKLGVQYPSIYDVRLMLQEGALTDAQATDILAKEGYPAELIKSLVAAFTLAGSTAKKAVTETMLADLYIEGAIDSAEFLKSLKAIGYTEAGAQLVIEVTNWKAELTARNSLISRTRSLYIGRKIDEQTAENKLRVALIPESVVARVMEDWNAELEFPSKTLSEAQVVNAWKLQLLASDDPPTNTTNAIARLMQLGYSQDDSLLILQVANKAPDGGFFSGNPSSSTQNTTGKTRPTG